jgi:hypothetical protein
MSSVSRVHLKPGRRDFKLILPATCSAMVCGHSLGFVKFRTWYKICGYILKLSRAEKSFEDENVYDLKRSYFKQKCGRRSPFAWLQYKLWQRCRRVWFESVLSQDNFPQSLLLVQTLVCFNAILSS